MVASQVPLEAVHDTILLSCLFFFYLFLLHYNHQLQLLYHKAILYDNGHQDFDVLLYGFREVVGIEWKRHHVLSSLRSDEGCDVLNSMAIGAHTSLPN